MSKKIPAELYPRYKSDRRMLFHVPGRGMSRRGRKLDSTKWARIDRRDGISPGERFIANIAVSISVAAKGGGRTYESYSSDISATGMLIEIPEGLDAEKGQTLRLRFVIPPGTMPEGYESSVKTDARVVRFQEIDGKKYMGVEFLPALPDLLGTRRWVWFQSLSIFLLGATLACIVYLKMDSAFYFLFDVPLFLYGNLASLFLVSRFFFGACYKNVKPVPLPPEQVGEYDFKYDYAPGVSVVIPCFNEEQWIVRTIRSCIDQYYPPDKLEVIVVDDGSSDHSVERIEEFCRDARPFVGDRLLSLPQKKNLGKRHALAAGVKAAKHDLVVFVDSDSFLAPEAIMHLVQPFKDPKMGAVSGRTEVENKWTNYLTKMQAVRYYVAFRIFKAAEALFDTVSCLSGPLACYRKDLVELHMDAWLNQKFFGMPATFGDDRSMTNFILKDHRTGYQDEAVCYTIVPSDYKVFLRQQMRWKRSWLRESLRAGKFMWKKEPFASFSFYAGLMLPIVAPVIVIRAMFYLPLFYGIMPFTFLFGLLLMCMLISSSYLLLKRSRLWVYGGVFCAFYLAVLIWQMPPALVTFWKAEWGTRDTAKDVEARRKKARPHNKENFDEEGDTEAQS